jgi:hypothetical protein
MTRRNDVLERIAPLFEPPADALTAFHQVRRGRERNRRIGAAIVAVALSATVAGLAIKTFTGPIPADREQLGQSATLNGLVLSYPDRWALLSYSSPSGDPDRPSHDLAVSPTGLKPDPREPCAGLGPSDAFLLVSFEMPAFPRSGPGEPSTAWPVPLRVTPDAGCPGVRMDAAWTEGGRAYHATLVTGTAVSPQVKEQLTAVFDTLVPSRETPSVGETGEVIAQGVFRDTTWTLTVRRDSQLGEGMGPVIAVVGEIPVFDAPLPGSIALHDNPAARGDTQLLGYVSAEVARVEMTLNGASHDVVLHDVPLDLANPLRAFFVPIPGSPTGSIDAYDANGTRLITVGFAPGTTCGPVRVFDSGALDTTQTCRDIGETTGPLFVASPNDPGWPTLGSSWRILREGDDLVLLDDRGEERGRLVDPTGSLAVAVANVPSRTPFVFGVAEEGITRVVLTSRDRPDTPAQRTWVLPDGRVAFVADFAPSYNRFQQVAGYDATCDVVVALDLRTLEEVEPDMPRC